MVPAMPPMEKRTRGGTPLATQKAPFQSIALCSLFVPAAAEPLVSALTLMSPSALLASEAICPLPHPAGNYHTKLCPQGLLLLTSIGDVGNDA